eukprot:TRINITY_DN9734_c0_g5_i1.p1 TRINITY_DN9734_c0_g5~~TRINITY_DN9734_c0_g5_i1.p1  ORF type:complete len:345 (+),score=54.89 TRINITY_DN9734_c0_g5_i1:258-1292(+)
MCTAIQFNPTTETKTLTQENTAQPTTIPNNSLPFATPKSILSINSLTPLLTPPLGKGTFGEVKLMKDAENEVYAVKEMDKLRLEGELEFVRREVAIHRKLSHCNVIKLVTVCEDANVIQLVLEYAPDGSLFDFIRRKGFLREEEAVKIFYRIAKGVKYLHNKNIIHRDLKPENILMADGVPKISDFGWSAECNGANQRNVCGTLEYMAPEVVYSGTYGPKIDIWALGILLYEMLHGYAPIKAKHITDMTEAFSRPLNLQFKTNLSLQAKSLITTLLQLDAEIRPNIGSVLKHPWLDSELVNDGEGEGEFEHDREQCKGKCNGSCQVGEGIGGEVEGEVRENRVE